MGIVFHTQDGKISDGYLATTGGCVVPESNVADDVVLFISFFQNDGLTTSLNAPTIGATTGDLIASASRVAAYRFDGGLIGTAQFSFATNPASFRAFFVRVSGLASASPYSAGFSASPSGPPYAISAGTTAPEPGAVFVALIGPTGYPFGNEESVSVGFDSPDSIFDADEDFNPVDGGFGGGGFRIVMPLNVAVRYAEDAGDIGFHSWTAVFSVIGATIGTSIAGFWISPLQAPSAPVVTAPETNSKHTVGSTQRITWESATDPNVDTEDLIYKVHVSNNHGISYELLTTTSPAVLFYDWDTTTYGAGTWMVKVVANNGTDDGEDGLSGEFQLFADVSPGAPTGLNPTGYISQAARTFTAIANNPDFDILSAYEIEWDTDPAFGSASTTGEEVSGTLAHAFSASTDILSVLGTQYWRVRTKGEVDNTFGQWSLPATVNVAAAPATPTITSSSTANKAFWPLTFTAIAHTQFRVRLELSGNVRLNTIVQSSAFSFTTPFGLLDGEVWDVYISVFDPVTGLESAEANQTLTVTYTGPAQPDIDVVALDGAFQLAITNPVPGDVDHNRILVSHNGGDFVLASPKLDPNALYQYHTAANDLFNDYNEYVFKARAFKVTTLGITDSDPSSGQGLTLDGLYIHVVDKVSTTSNAGLRVKLMTTGPIIKRFVKKHRSVPMKGSTQFKTYAGQFKQTVLVYNVVIPRDDTTTYPALKACFDANRTLCARDSDHNIVFGRILDLPREDDLAKNQFTLTFMQEHFTEAYTR